MTMKAMRVVPKSKCSLNPLEEYVTLRSEINSIQEQQRSVWIAMYTLYIAIFVLAMEISSYYLLLAAYIILIPFQYIINTQNWSVQKISAYIRCFYEDENRHIHWEGLHRYSGYRKHYEKYGDGRWASYMGATMLGSMSTGFFITLKILEIYHNKSTNIVFDIFMILLSVVLLLLTFAINIRYKNRYQDKLMEVMNDYKKSLRR